MPFTAIDQNWLSDLIVYEYQGLFSREMITVNISAGATLRLGAILTRVKSIDPTAAWDIIDASGDVTINNEYAVYLGDRYDVRDNVPLVVAAATATPVLAIRRHARLKETIPKAALVPSVLNQTQFNQLKEALKLQGVILEDALAPIVP